MKKIAILCCAAFIIVLSAFVAGRKNSSSGIHGTVSPADAVLKVWAVNGKDSVGASPVSGSFNIDIKPGSCKLHVQAMKGYKDVFVDNITVEEGSYTDAGEIKLSAN